MGGPRLSDRIGERPPQARLPKRKRDSLAGAPEGVKIDPRAAKVASYQDLDSSVPAGDTELDY